MAAENRDFGRFLTNWYNVHCKHTLFFEFLGLSNEFFIEEAWFWGVRVGFGGREGALASALIINIVGVSLGSLPVTRHILIFYECYCVITLYCLCHLHSLNSLSSLSSIQRIQYKYNHRLCQGLEQSSLTPFWTHKVSIIILGPHLQKT